MLLYAIFSRETEVTFFSSEVLAMLKHKTHRYENKEELQDYLSFSLSFLKKRCFRFGYVYVCVWFCVHECRSGYIPCSLWRLSDPLELAVVSNLIWVLGTKSLILW